MKILIEFDSLTNDTKVISKSIPIKKDIIKECCEYYQISYSQLISTPLVRDSEYVACRWLVSYLLSTICKIEQLQIAEILNYSDPSSISVNIKEFKNKMSSGDVIIKRPYINLCKILGIIPENFK